jgi:hypothetical protein
MSSPIISKKRFSKLEDQHIIQLVNQIGRKWKIIESFIEGRKANQIRERYLNYLDNDLKSLPWNREEDNLLLTSASRFSFCWKQMEIYFPGRTDVHLKNRFKFLRKQFQKLKPQNETSNTKQRSRKHEKQIDFNQEKSAQIEIHFESHFNPNICQTNLFDFDEDWLAFWIQK